MSGRLVLIGGRPQDRGGPPHFFPVLVGLDRRSGDAGRRPPTRRRRRGSGRRAAASPRTGCRAPRTPRRAPPAPRPVPSRSRRPREARPRCGSGDRPARAAPRCRRRPARHAAPAPRADARARPTAGAPQRIGPCGRRAVFVRREDRGGASTPAAAHPAAARPGYSTEKSTAAPAPCRSATKSAQPVRQRLLAAHRGQRGHRHVQAVGGLLDGAGQQRVRGQLGEDPVAVIQRGPHRRGRTAPCAAGCRPSTRRRRPAVRAGRTGSPSSREPPACVGVRSASASPQLVEDRIDLRGMRGHVDGHLAGHHVALLPGRHQVAHRLGGAADHRRLRGGHHRDHDVA